MTITQKRIAAVIATVVYCYLSSAFIAKEANPLNWSDEGRFSFTLFVSAFTALAALLPFSEDAQ